jgi:peroxidase
LLAAEIDAFRHNAFDAEDVNDDGEVTAVDALTIMNAIRRQSTSDSEMFTDVDRDGLRSPADALRVTNRIRRGQSPGDFSRGDRNHGGEIIPAIPDEVRSIDGTGNNLEDAELGSTGESSQVRCGQAKTSR